MQICDGTGQGPLAMLRGTKGRWTQGRLSFGHYWGHYKMTWPYPRERGVERLGRFCPIWQIIKLGLGNAGEVTQPEGGEGKTRPPSNSPRCG